MAKFSRPFGQIFTEMITGGNQTGVSPDLVGANQSQIEAKLPPNPTAPPHSDVVPMSRLMNIGCGYDKRAGYLNIDMDPLCEPDFLVNGENSGNLPSNYFEKVLAKDVLEHIPRTQTLAALLQWSHYLKVGGRLELQTSSVYGIVDMMRQRETFEHHYGMTVCMFGSQAHAGDFHYAGFTEKTLRVHLLAAGFMPISIKLMDDWLFHVQAFKFEDWAYEPDVKDKIAALSLRALGRDPDPHHYVALGASSYLEAARGYYASVERLYYTAAKYGL